MTLPDTLCVARRLPLLVPYCKQGRFSFCGTASARPCRGQYILFYSKIVWYLVRDPCYTGRKENDMAVNPQTIVDALKRRGFGAYYAQTAQDAVAQALALIPHGASVSWGGSVSVQESGLLDAVKAGDYALIDRDMAATSAEAEDIMRRALTADVFLTSFNAVSEDGVLYNIDGRGNRVSAIAFGAKSVVALVGMNKIVATEAGLEHRALSVAAPKNAKRLGKEAADICAIFVKTRMSIVPERIKVILVGEDLGY